MGHKVYVVTSNLYFPFPNYEQTFQNILGPRKFNPGNKNIDGIEVICLPVYFEQPGKRVLFKHLKEKVFEIEPDLVIAHGEYAFYKFTSLSLEEKVEHSLVIDSHCHPQDKDPKDNKKANILSRLKSKLLFFIFRKYLWSRDDILGLNIKLEFRFFSKRCEISQKKKINLISHGSEIDRFYPNRKIKKYRKIGIRDNDIVILYTGKISERKCSQNNFCY